ncbi:hypothetical protein BDEG_23658 [Batrachochytrium dendrobatidis JEL423]|uniref:Mid2 domain-containing protein n=1 Tax=Batrachochytrium dendrobatidis (strain JEL423) TaxID=403673 RepID=A0A177WJL0_BATDL|nr:hypothetical protein BDEG_23658 [Batrachochytrium dendrobatidis JEL423]
MVQAMFRLLQVVSSLFLLQAIIYTRTSTLAQISITLPSIATIISISIPPLTIPPTTLPPTTTTTITTTTTTLSSAVTTSVTTSSSSIESVTPTTTLRGRKTTEDANTVIADPTATSAASDKSSASNSSHSTTIVVVSVVACVIVFSIIGLLLFRHFAQRRRSQGLSLDEISGGNNGTTFPAADVLRADAANFRPAVTSNPRPAQGNNANVAHNLPSPISPLGGALHSSLPPNEQQRLQMQQLQQHQEYDPRNLNQYPPGTICDPSINPQIYSPAQIHPQYYMPPPLSKPAAHLNMYRTRAEVYRFSDQSEPVFSDHVHPQSRYESAPHSAETIQSPLESIVPATSTMRAEHDPIDGGHATTLPMPQAPVSSHPVSPINQH